MLLLLSELRDSMVIFRRPVRLKPDLLLLLHVHRVLAEPRAVFLQLELFAPRLAPEGVVVIAGLLANQKHCFGLLFAFPHRNLRVCRSGFSLTELVGFWPKSAPKRRPRNRAPILANCIALDSAAC